VLFNVGLVHGFRYHLPTAVTAVLAVAPSRRWRSAGSGRSRWLAVVTGVCCALTAHGRVPNLVYVALGMAILHGGRAVPPERPRWPCSSSSR